MNLPNALTVLRVLAVPIFIYLIVQPDMNLRMWALGLFVVASLTDLLDGYLARKWKQETEFGKFLDPLADKTLVLGAFITFIFLSNQVQVWMVLAIVARDLLITSLRYIAVHRGRSLRTSRLGKWKTAFQMFSIVVILLSIVFVSYKERRFINDMYGDARIAGVGPWQISWESFQTFISGESSSVIYGLSTFVPYYLMLITTAITIISGLRYIVTNYQLFLPRSYSDGIDESNKN